MNDKQITYKPTYKGMPILTDENKKLGCYKPILEKLKNNFDDMTSKHHKTFFMRYDVRFPDDHQSTPQDNKTFRDFQANLIKNLSRQKLDPHYLWATEQKPDRNHQHYHGILLLDGQKTKSIKNHIEKAEELWARALNRPVDKNNGLIDDCTKKRKTKKNPTDQQDDDSEDKKPKKRQKNGIMLRKDDPKYDIKVKQCFKWGSYLATVSSKTSFPKGTRTFSSSRIPN
jgi:hypothetical protein